MGHDWLAAAFVLGLYPPRYAEIGGTPQEWVRLQASTIVLLLGTVAETFVLQSPALIAGATVLLAGMVVAMLPAVGAVRRRPS